MFITTFVTLLYSQVLKFDFVRLILMQGLRKLSFDMFSLDLSGR